MFSRHSCSTILSPISSSSSLSLPDSPTGVDTTDDDDDDEYYSVANENRSNKISYQHDNNPIQWPSIVNTNVSNVYVQNNNSNLCQFDSLCFEQKPTLSPTILSIMNQNGGTGIEFGFRIKIDRIRISWISLDDSNQRASQYDLNQPNSKQPLDYYQIRACLLTDDVDDSSEECLKKRRSIKQFQHKEYHHRHHKTKWLTKEPVISRKIRNIKDSSSSIPGTEIMFDQQEITFTCKIPLEKDRKFLSSKVVRLKLEHGRKSHPFPVGNHLEPVGFIDLDLSHQLMADQCCNFRLPMVLFSDYNKRIVQRYYHKKLRLDDFCFEIWFNLESMPIFQPEVCPLKLSFELDEINHLKRVDSLPNLSEDKELKYHESPPPSLYKHFLNLFGLLPRGQLFRVAIHFGQIEHLLINDSDVHSVCACFEVKHHSTICCRTKQLAERNFSETECGYFDQYFTFFEQFSDQDSPETCLSIMTDNGKKLYKFKCHLVDYVNCRSVNQYFYLEGKHGTYCRLQFSIVVKPIHR